MTDKINLIYPLKLIQTPIECNISPKKSILLSDLMRSMMLYCLCDMGNDQFLPLNRDYKPLGMVKSDFVKYEEYPFLFIPKDMIDFTLFWDNGISFGRHGYFTFADSTYPQDTKLFQRYRTIILGAFFGMSQFNTKEMFIKLWGYKQRSSREDYNLNLSKFKNASVDDPS